MPRNILPLINEIEACQLCATHLPHSPRPVVQAHSQATLLIIGQAPGRKVHESGIPWDDASGQRLRQWLRMSPEQFYDKTQVAIVPMGFCYPGKGKSGDLPPRKECAPKWHGALLEQLPNIKIALLIGQYAQQHYLGQSDFGQTFRTLTERCLNAQECPSPFIPLPHPSPRNQIWLKKNPWFEQVNVPSLQQKLAML